MFGELKSIREKVLQNLLQTLRIRLNRLRMQRGTEFNIEVKSFAIGYVTEGLGAIVLQLGEPHAAYFDVHLAGLNLAEVENIADKSKQVGSRRMNCLGKLYLLGR